MIHGTQEALNELPREIIYCLAEEQNWLPLGFRAVAISVIDYLQLAIHVVQNRRAGEQKSHWDKTNKRHVILDDNFLCLSCPSATFALQHGGFVPREWLAVMGLLVELFRMNSNRDAHKKKACLSR